MDPGLVTMSGEKQIVFASCESFVACLQNGKNKAIFA